MVLKLFVLKKFRKKRYAESSQSLFVQEEISLKTKVIHLKILRLKNLCGLLFVL